MKNANLKKTTIKQNTPLLPEECIENKILLIRGLKVMLDRDLAKLYGVETKTLNQAIKRNQERFPGDFMFKLTKLETKKVVTNCDHLAALKFSSQTPHAFTEQGVTMLACILNSKRAIQVNIQIIRTLTKLRQLMTTHKELREKIEAMEKSYDHQFAVIFDAIKKLLQSSSVKSGKMIGFHVD